MEARYEETVFVDCWYVKLFEQGQFSSRSQYSTLVSVIIVYINPAIGFPCFGFTIRCR